jgi:transcription elongation factor GreA
MRPCAGWRGPERTTLDLPKAKYILTETGFKKFEAELETLQGRRVQVASEIRTAKGYGDLSENFEYHEAKRQAGFLEGRILELRAVLPAAHVVTPDQVPNDEVWFGSRVHLRDLEYDDEFTYVIVGPLEANPDEDRISYESPLGQALFGKHAGDTVEIQVPAGTSRYEIVELGVYAGE